MVEITFFYHFIWKNVLIESLVIFQELHPIKSSRTLKQNYFYFNFFTNQVLNNLFQRFEGRWKGGFEFCICHTQWAEIFSLYYPV